jgi:PPOX class probable F420-dependent enzyme
VSGALDPTEEHAMATMPDAARALLDSDALAHVVTVNPDGSPQLSCVWVGLEGEELVVGSLSDRQKLRNVRRDPRVALSLASDRRNDLGLLEYLVVHGHGRVEEGGAPELLQWLAFTYIGPGVRFPPMDSPPPGYVLRIVPERFGGVGPWT